MKSQKANLKLNRNPAMNENELIIEKFHACTGVQKHLITGWYYADEPIYSVDVSLLKKQILEYGMQEYSKLLLRYMEYQQGQLELLKNSSLYIDKIKKEDANSKQIKSELLDFLNKLLTKEKLTQINFTLSKNNAYITNDELINIVADTLKKEFIKREYNITPLTTAEVEKIYNEKTDSGWFNSWKQELEYYDEKGNSVVFDELKNGERYFSPYYDKSHDIEFIRQEMFNAYALEHPKKRTLDLQLIKQLKAEPQEKAKTGRNEINSRITQIAFALADLDRIDEFISNPNITDIDEIKVKNTIGNLIYDMLVCFGMKEHNPGKFNKKYKPHNYTKGLLKNKIKSKKFDFQMYLRKIRLSSLKNILTSN